MFLRHSLRVVNPIGIRCCLNNNLLNYTSKKLYSGGGSLSKQIIKEIEDESKYIIPSDIKKYSSLGWKYSERVGSEKMSLTKTSDWWHVCVTFNTPTPVTFTYESHSVDIDFVVTVCRGGGCNLTVSCTMMKRRDDKIGFIINSMDFNSEKEEAYSGPQFDHLDEKFQEAIEEWLASIGVNEELCEFVFALSHDKEYREYVEWLKKFNSLVS
eukprot:GHVR01165643.1.p1 GENE.GHVR01165643.1~~GHVR01165643.1.p1  ORF type:complete len:233 (+),score=48.81 GHVR01165643.1:65-700(+)